MTRRWGPPLAALAGLILMVELLSAIGWINVALLPPPHQVLASLWAQREDFTRAFAETSAATVMGFLMAAVGGFSAALIFSWLAWLRRAILPFAIFFQTVPIIAVAPLLVIYFGFGISTVTVASAIVAVFPVLANTLLGLESVDPGYLELMQIYRATPVQILFMVRLPAAYPSIYAGLKVAVGLSVIGAVAGEFVAGGGLGAIIDSARTQQRLDLVYAALMLLSVLGLALLGGLKVAHRALNAYRPYGLFLKDE